MHYYQRSSISRFLRYFSRDQHFDCTERIEGIAKEKDVIESHLARLPRKRTNPDGKRASWKDNVEKRNPMELGLLSSLILRLKHESPDFVFEGEIRGVFVLPCTYRTSRKKKSAFDSETAIDITPEK